MNYYYVFLQFCGYVLQVVPGLLLVFIPFADGEFRFGKRRTMLAVMIGAIVMCALSAFYLGGVYSDKLVMGDPKMDRVGMIANVLFSVIMLCGTVVYVLSFVRGTRGRVLHYTIGMQYMFTAYMLAEIFSKSYGDYTNRVYYAPYGRIAVLVYALTALILLPLICGVLKRYEIRKQKFHNQRNVRLITICSFAIFVLYIVALLVCRRIYWLSADWQEGLLICIWMVCMLIVELLVYFMFFAVIRIEDEKGSMQAQMLAFDIQYQTLHDKIESEREFRHNLRHHFRTLIGLMENRQNDEAIAYMQEYLKEYGQRPEEAITQNPVFNSILEYYIVLARQKGIRIEHEVMLRESYGFDLADLTVLLGNALENAVEACMGSGLAEPEIRIDIRQKKQMLLIKIENSCDETPLRYSEENGVPYSSKEGRGRGCGISSMMQAAEKYQGNVEFWKNEQRFTLRILLSIPESPVLEADRQQ